MCGIAAIFAYDANAESVDEGELTAVRDHMASRGPDGSGQWFDAKRRVGLGHRRLSILDLSDAGAQPMHLAQRRLTIVFNGEIYNHRELRSRLEARGEVFQSTSDTEVLLRLYAQKGHAMMNDLRGMYAFAIWDGEKRGLFLARDPYGIKPLYVADDGKTLRAASQVKALLAGRRLRTSHDPAGHTGFFLWGHVPEPFTLHREIRALPAGTTLWVDESGVNERRTFCSIPALLAGRPLEQHDETPGRGATSRAETLKAAPGDSQLATALRDSVAHHLIADVPVGVFLSSGLDSATLAALASGQGGRLRTVTLGFEEFRGTADDEVPLAELMAKQLGAEHQTVWVTRQDYVEQSGRLLDAMDQPSIDGLNTYFVSLAARRAGLKVALSGLGGDELFGGYPSFTEVPKAVKALRYFEAESLQPVGPAFRKLSAPVLKRFTSPKYASLLEYGGSYAGAYFLRRALFMPWELPRFMDGNLVHEGWTALQPLVRLAETIEGMSSPRARVCALETNWYMRNQLLRDADWAGMAHSLEIRVPLVDITLLRSLVPALNSPTPPTKRDMAAAAGSALPASVLDRPKTGFRVPVREWLLGSRQKAEGRNRKSGERGLRGWARHVYARFTGVRDAG